MQFFAFHLSDGKCIIKIYILYIIYYLSEEAKHLQSKRMKEIWERKRSLKIAQPAPTDKVNHFD